MVTIVRIVGKKSSRKNCCARPSRIHAYTNVEDDGRHCNNTQNNPEITLWMPRKTNNHTVAQLSQMQHLKSLFMLKSIAAYMKKLE